MKLKTVRVRRSRPTAPALALALALTMLCVYLISLSAAPEAAVDEAAVGGAAVAVAPGESELRMEGLEAAFVCDGLCDDLTSARVAAANCASQGGAGMLLGEEGRFAVIREAVAPDAAPEGALLRRAEGITLRLSGPAGDIAAVSDAVRFLRAQAAETGGLAGALESGGADASSLTALLEVYRTQGDRAGAALAEIADGNEITRRLSSAVQSGIDRLNAAIASPDPGKLKLLHAAACGEWIQMLTDFPTI